MPRQEFNDHMRPGEDQGEMLYRRGQEREFLDSQILGFTIDLAPSLGGQARIVLGWSDTTEDGVDGHLARVRRIDSDLVDGMRGKHNGVIGLDHFIDRLDDNHSYEHALPYLKRAIQDTPLLTEDQRTQILDDIKKAERNLAAVDPSIEVPGVAVTPVLKV